MADTGTYMADTSTYTRLFGCRELRVDTEWLASDQIEGTLSRITTLRLSRSNSDNPYQATNSNTTSVAIKTQICSTRPIEDQVLGWQSADRERFRCRNTSFSKEQHLRNLDGAKLESREEEECGDT